MAFKQNVKIKMKWSQGRRNATTITTATTTTTTTTTTTIVPLFHFLIHS